MDLDRLTTNPVDTQWVSVSVERNQQCNLHAGIVHRTGENEVKKLHFGWHRSLYNYFVTGPVVCAIPDVAKPAHRLWLAVFCGLVADNIPKRNIPYSLKHDEDVAFDERTGEVKFGNEDSGLNCATFVVAVFRCAGHPLINSKGWPKASIDDIAIQKQSVRSMLDSSDPDIQQQGRKNSRDIGTPRIRPDHVAGACLEKEAAGPARFAACEANSAHVVTALDSHLACQA
ncbi:MAG: hypothetical protein WD872_07255 [Pirellulaceae bacterium]